MKDLMEVVKGINQAVHNAQFKETGALEREKAKHIRDIKINDSFTVRFNDDKVIVEYTINVKNALLPNMTFNLNVEDKFTEIIKYIKKEYKNITGNTVDFKSESKLSSRASPTSFVSQVNTYKKVYSIKGVESASKLYQKELKKYYDNSISKIETLEEQLKKKLNEATEFRTIQRHDLNDNIPDRPLSSMEEAQKKNLILEIENFLKQAKKNLQHFQMNSSTCFMCDGDSVLFGNVPCPNCKNQQFQVFKQENL